MDRIDLCIEVPRINNAETRQAVESSAVVRQRVDAAWLRQTRRSQQANARLSPTELTRFAALDDSGNALLESASERLMLSERARQRVQRVSRTIADLEGAERVAMQHLAEALSYRTPASFGHRS